jgi:hypothetical protein
MRSSSIEAIGARKSLRAGHVLCVFLLAACTSPPEGKPASASNSTAKVATPPPGDKSGAEVTPGAPMKVVPGTGVVRDLPASQLRDGIEWLDHHQSIDGSWDCDGFMANCGKIGNTVCDGAGESNHDVGITGLALLAFMGDGNTPMTGQYKETVAKGIKWLKDQQDFETGILGKRVGHGFMYNHAIGTLALCEAYFATKSPFLRRTTQDAIAFIARARNPYSAWRYEYPPTGENDTSVTGWMVFALKCAEDGELTIDKAAYAGATSWFDEVTDPATGRTGYDSVGSQSSRMTGINEQYPPDKGEAMTAVALLCRFFMGEDPARSPIMEKQAALLRADPPVYNPDGFGNDFGYWYFGSYAMFQMGGSKYWAPWCESIKRATLESQRTDGDAKGSWDPKDAWGHAGGRIYTTALGALCLEVIYRYQRLEPK